MHRIIHSRATAFAASLTLLAGLSLPAFANVDTSPKNLRDEGITPVSELQDGPADATPSAVTPQQHSLDSIQSMEYKPVANDITSADSIQPVSSVAVPAPEAVTQQIPTVAVFPLVIHQSRNIAFADLPVLAASVTANQLALKGRQNAQAYAVLNPIIAFDILRAKGYEGVYQQMVRDTLQSGRPNPADLAMLADQLDNKTQRVDWIIFVKADLDTNHTSKPSVLQSPFSYLLGKTPDDPNYFVTTSMQIFSVADASVPMIWSDSSHTPIRMSAFDNFTKSVYDSSDSQRTFSKASEQMAGRLISRMPALVSTQNNNVFGRIVPTIVSPISSEVRSNLKNLTHY